MNQVYSANVAIVGRDAKDPASGDLVHSAVALVLTSKGGTVPGPAWLAAIPVVALLRRRRR